MLLLNWCKTELMMWNCANKGSLTKANSWKRKGRNAFEVTAINLNLLLSLLSCWWSAWKNAIGVKKHWLEAEGGWLVKVERREAISEWSFLTDVCFHRGNPISGLIPIKERLNSVKQFEQFEDPRIDNIGNWFQRLELILVAMSTEQKDVKKIVSQVDG